MASQDKVERRIEELRKQIEEAEKLLAKKEQKK